MEQKAHFLQVLPSDGDTLVLSRKSKARIVSESVFEPFVAVITGKDVVKASG